MVPHIIIFNGFDRLDLRDVSNRFILLVPEHLAAVSSTATIQTKAEEKVTGLEKHEILLGPNEMVGKCQR